jgi:hypothetical protein
MWHENCQNQKRKYKLVNKYEKNHLIIILIYRYQAIPHEPQSI